jgi:hypothetical protein
MNSLMNPLPRGRQLVTLEDAGRYITKLPKAEHDAQEWQAAMEALILVATEGGPTMFVRDDDASGFRFLLLSWRRKNRTWQALGD